jgi:cellobiose-specific phosphotransferase system component IIB
MQNEFVNRLNMFETSLGTLNRPANKAVWDGQPPEIFGPKVAAASLAVDNLRALARKHGVDITGAAKDKKEERAEAVSATDILENALWVWFMDRGDLTNAEKVDKSLTDWRRMEEVLFVEAALWVADTAAAIINGPAAAEAAKYGVTAAALQSAQKEVADFDAILTAPQQDIAARHSITQILRGEFRKVEAHFVSLDKLIPQYQSTPAGRATIAAYQASRNIIDRGKGPKPTPPATP